MVILPVTIAPCPAGSTRVETKEISGKSAVSRTLDPFIAWAANGKLASAEAASSVTVTFDALAWAKSRTRSALFTGIVPVIRSGPKSVSNPTDETSG